MKRLLYGVAWVSIATWVVLAVAVLAGCAAVPEASAQQPVRTLREVTHADLQAAAQRAEKNGYPARAAVWRSFDAQLTAWENQVAACKSAISAAIPQPGSAEFAGVFDALEAGAEAVGAGVPVAVRVNCEPLPIPQMPIFPGIPKL